MHESHRTTFPEDFFSFQSMKSFSEGKKDAPQLIAIDGAHRDQPMKVWI